LLKSGIPSFLSGAPYRLGYLEAREMSHLFLTHKVSVDNGKMHSVDRYLAILSVLGISVGEKDFSIVLTPGDQEGMANLLEGHGVLPGETRVVLNAPTRWQSKRWPQERFAELGDQLASRLGAKIILTGGRADQALVEEIASLMRVRPVVAAGKTSLKELCWLLREVDLLVTCDSGPMHIAAAVGTPTIALFGPTDPRRTGPYGRGHRVLQRQMVCIPCFKRDCPENLCLREIEVEEVFSAAKEALRGREASSYGKEAP
jgi:lipopolysaccharide heptosyltransferase II